MFNNKFDTIEVELTQGCPLKCKHCFAEKLFGPMSETTFNNMIDFLIDISATTSEPKLNIVLTGGEPGTFDMVLLKNGLTRLKENAKNKIYIIFQTSLLYTLTPEHFDLFNICDMIGVSWDYKGRYKSIDKELIFFENLAKVKALNKEMGMIISMTDVIVKEVPPEMLMSFILSTGIKHFDINRLFTPLTTDKETFRKQMSVTNKEIREYQFQLFKLYDQIKEKAGLYFFDFECLIDGLNGSNHNQYSKICPTHLIHINAAGEIMRCMDISGCNFGNVNTKSFDKEKYEAVVAEHKKYIEPECKGCKYFSACQCGCPWMYRDETGCSVPYKIIDYLKLKDTMKEEQR